MLLKLGSQGEDVKKLQIKLGVDPIGTFGPKTDVAVKSWQASNGLTADGIVGDGTWGKMFSGEVIKEDVVIPTGGPFKLEKLIIAMIDLILSDLIIMRYIVLFLRYFSKN